MAEDGTRASQSPTRAIERGKRRDQEEGLFGVEMLGYVAGSESAGRDREVADNISHSALKRPDMRLSWPDQRDQSLVCWRRGIGTTELPSNMPISQPLVGQVRNAIQMNANGGRRRENQEEAAVPETHWVPIDLVARRESERNAYGKGGKPDGKSRSASPSRAARSLSMYDVWM